MLVEQDLGREVLGRTAERRRQLVGPQIGFGQPEITQSDVSCSVEEDVLWLQIARNHNQPTNAQRKIPKNSPINNIILVQMLQRQHQLGNIKLCPLLTKPRLPLQMPKQLAPTLKIRHKIQIRIRLETKLEANKEGTLQGPLQDLALPDCMRHLLFGDDFLFGEHFHGVDALGVAFADLENFAERASADEFEEFEIAGGERAFGLFVA